jgi:hypothetical protein
MPAEIGHEACKLTITAAIDDLERFGVIRELILELAAPALGTLEHQRRIKLVRAFVDPLAEPFSARLPECGFQQLAVLDEDHFPTEILEEPGHLHEELIGDHRVQALAVVVHDPPAVLEAVLPVLQQRLVDVALVHLGVAHEGDQTPFRPVLGPALGVHVILHEAGEACGGNAQPHRARRKVDVGRILRARGIGLHAAKGAKILQLAEILVAQQILDGMEDRAGVRLDRDPVLRPQHVEVERRHERRQRRRRGLMSPHLQAVAPIHLVIGVVDHVSRKPQDLALQLAQHGERRFAVAAHLSRDDVLHDPPRLHLTFPRRARIPRRPWRRFANFARNIGDLDRSSYKIGTTCKKSPLPHSTSSTGACWQSCRRTAGSRRRSWPSAWA